MSRYISCAAGLFDDFERYRTASRKWSKSSRKYLQSFDRYCLNGWPDARELNQDMVDGWFKKKTNGDPNITLNQGIYCNVMHQISSQKEHP